MWHSLSHVTHPWLKHSEVFEIFRIYFWIYLGFFQFVYCAFLVFSFLSFFGDISRLSRFFLGFTFIILRVLKITYIYIMPYWLLLLFLYCILNSFLCNFCNLCSFTFNLNYFKLIYYQLAKFISSWNAYTLYIHIDTAICRFSVWYLFNFG